MSTPKKKTPWLSIIGIAVFGLWLAVTLIVKYEPTDTRFATADVRDNNVLSEATDTGTRFIYETVFALKDGQNFKLESLTAPPAVQGPICAEISIGKLSGQARYALAAPKDCP